MNADPLGGAVRALAIVLVVLLAPGCDLDPTVVERPGEPLVVVYPPGENAMTLAISDARNSVQGFIRAIPDLRSRGIYFSVKVPVEAEGDTEHIWLADTDYRDNEFYGTLGNEPLSASHAFGDRHSVHQDEISDWMVVRDGVLYGGFTIFVARDQLDPQQRTEFNASVDFTIPPKPQTF